MRTSVKKNPDENRFIFELSHRDIHQLQTKLADPLDRTLDAWWQDIGKSMGFDADSVRSVRWTLLDGRVVAKPPLDQECSVSFTAIAVPVGLPDDLGRGFREWLLAAHPKLVWEIDGQGRLSGTLFHPAALEEAFDAGRDYSTEAFLAAFEATEADDPLVWLQNVARGVHSLCGIATKSISLIKKLEETNARLLAERLPYPLPADAFIKMEVKAKPDDDPVFAVKTQDPRFTPDKQITINGFAFVPI